MRQYVVIVAAMVTAVPFSVSAATNRGVEEAVRDYFADVPVMVAIAKCESDFKMFSGDKALDGGSGGMIGIFQINSSVHAQYAKNLGMDIYTLNGNLAYARYLYENEGARPWNSSSACWKKEPLEAAKTPNKSQASSAVMSTEETETQIARLRAIIAVLTHQLLELRKSRELASR